LIGGKYTWSNNQSEPTSEKTGQYLDKYWMGNNFPLNKP
jgi:hypothetical protein